MLMRELLSTSVALSKCGSKQCSKPALKANGDELELDLGLELKKNAEITPAPDGA
jgi:hypothetical protein